MLTTLQEFLGHLLDLALDMAPWLLLGLVTAGLIRALVPARLILRWLGGPGLVPVVKAALLGAPMPLCSCSALPTAVTLHRNGASKASTVSFLVATPETNVNSFAVSFALLGPFLAIVRPIAAIISAITAGLAAGAVDKRLTASSAANTPQPAETSAPSCGDECGCAKQTNPLTDPDKPRPGIFVSVRDSLTTLLDDLAPWLVLGIVVAAGLLTFVDPDQWREVGDGLPAMLTMLAVSLPIYACATASTPVAVGFLLAGLSPGTVLVFLLAGPATNIGAIAIVRRELGTAVAVTYIAAIALSAVGLGLLVNVVVGAFSISVVAQASDATFEPPQAVGITALVILLLCAFRPLRRWCAMLFGRPAVGPEAAKARC